MEALRERAAAVDALQRSRGMKFVDLARGSLRELGGPAKEAVREILQRRGVSV